MAGMKTDFPGASIAAVLLITERRLQQLCAEEWIPRGQQRGMYPLVQSIQGYIRYLKSRDRDAGRGSGHARLANAQANKVEMENLRRMGELQVTGQAEETMQGLIVRMKSALEGLPGRLASELAAISEPPRVYQRLQAEHREVLHQCVDYLEKRAASLEAMPDPRETPEAIDPGAADELGAEEPDDAAGFPGAGQLPGE